MLNLICFAATLCSHNLKKEKIELTDNNEDTENNNITNTGDNNYNTNGCITPYECIFATKLKKHIEKYYDPYKEKEKTPDEELSTTNIDKKLILNNLNITPIDMSNIPNFNDTESENYKDYNEKLMKIKKKFKHMVE